jgi:signal transduction histidine kinase
MDLTFVETTLSNILKLAIEPYAEAIQNRHQTLVARGLRDLPPIYGDYKRLVQAFQNVITNAIKYTPDGGTIDVLGEVSETDADGSPSSVRISITDSGVGVDATDHELIFEKFFRVGSVALHSTGATKFKGAGPGLGLPIARGIIEGHGGKIWVESAGHDEDTFPGATFHIVLPVKPPAIEAQRRLREIQAAKQETVIAGRATLDDAEDPSTDNDE